jgi:hypothetical protein
VTDLELELRDLAAHLDVPRTPALSGAVLARVAHRRRRRLTIAFAVGIAATVLAVAFAVPGSRASLLRFFHLRGASVTLVDRLPKLTAHRSLGDRIALDQAGFRLLLPSGQRPKRSTPATAVTGSAIPACSSSSSRATAARRSSRRPRSAGRASSTSASAESRASGSTGVTPCTSPAALRSPPAAR